MTSIVEQINAAFKEDQLRLDRKVFKATELPLSYEAITDEWLTAVLCKKHAGAAVVGHQLDVPDNGSSNRRKIYIDYNARGREADLPTALFCKASHGLTSRIALGVSGAAHAETSFYNDIRPLLNIEAPQSFFASYDPRSFNSIIMMRDLSKSVTSFCTHETEVTRQRVESQLTLLAEFHGKGYSSPAVKAQLARLTTWPEFFTATLAFGMKDGSNRGFLAAEQVISPQLYRRYEEIWPATMASVERHNQLPQTLGHGDVHLKNWYIAGNGGMGLSDWQCAHRGHWGRDFAYTITTALTVENRRAWDRDLLHFYLDRMQAAGGPKIDFNEAWGHYRQQLLTALTWWTVTLTPPEGMPDMQPRDITLEFIRRITTAMDDVDSLGSFH
jgi:hypothetical protein